MLGSLSRLLVHCVIQVQLTNCCVTVGGIYDVILDQMPKVLQYYTSDLKYKFM